MTQQNTLSPSDIATMRASMDTYLEQIIVKPGLKHVLDPNDMFVKGTCGHRYITKYVNRADLLAKLGRACPKCLPREKESLPSQKGQKPMNQYWQHKTSGDIYAVQYDNGTVISACGPLHHSEVTSENLETWNFNNEPELSEDLNEHQDDYRHECALWGDALDCGILPSASNLSPEINSQEPY